MYRMGSEPTIVHGTMLPSTVTTHESKKTPAQHDEEEPPVAGDFGVIGNS